MNNTAKSLLSRALAKGEEEGVFVFPKGPSGKVKLAPKKKPLTSKEVSCLAVFCKYVQWLTDLFTH